MPDQPLNILLIEDSPDHSELFLANLAMTAYAGARTVRCDTSQLGLEILRAKAFDLLFIDLSLWDSSIVEALERLPEPGGACPVIVLTSPDDRRTVLDVISKGADDCLPKSELNDILLERVIHFNLDRWRLKQQLVESREAYRDLYHNSPDMLISVDAATGGVLTCNQTAAEKLGFSREEIIGREVFQLYHPDSLPDVRKAFALFLATGVVKNAELQLVSKDGGRIDVLLNVSAIRDENGKILRSRSTWIDITERKQTERALLASKKRMQRYLTAIDGINLGLFVVDADYRVRDMNRTMIHWFGDQRGRICYQSVADRDTPCPYCRLKEVVEEGKTVKYQPSTPDGQTFDIIAAPIVNPEGGICKMEMIRDITEQEQAKTKLLALNSQLEEAMVKAHEMVEQAEAANRAKSVFLSNMSHELRTPLNAILGYTQIFADDSLLNAKQRSGIRTIHQAGEHLLLLINDILDISKIESGRLELVESEVRLSSFLQGIRNIIQLRAGEKGLEFRYEVDESIPSVILADELRLRQVLLNLLSNAVKFTEHGYCVLRINAEQKDADKVLLNVIVEDSGPGITEKDQKMVFEPFLQVGERLQHREGSGLGLSISRQLVRLMGGELRLASPLNRNSPSDEDPGSRFFFSIEVPVLDNGVITDSPRRRVTGYTSSAKNGGVKTVLAVDDKTSNRAVLRDILEPLGFIVQEATDGGEVLSACACFRPDIILMDLRMPETDGFTAAAMLKEQPEFAHIPIVAVTASVLQSDVLRKRCLEYGFSAYIHKPFSVEKLLETIAAHLHIELSYAESEKLKNQEVAEEIIAPSQAILDELTSLVELGDIQGIAEKVLEISEMEAGGYLAFSRRAQKLADEFQFTVLLKFISGSQKN